MTIFLLLLYKYVQIAFHIFSRYLQIFVLLIFFFVPLSAISRKKKCTKKLKSIHHIDNISHTEASVCVCVLYLAQTINDAICTNDFWDKGRKNQNLFVLRYGCCTFFLLLDAFDVVKKGVCICRYL
jgi:hypothetical protein